MDSINHANMYLQFLCYNYIENSIELTLIKVKKENCIMINFRVHKSNKFAITYCYKIIAHGYHKNVGFSLAPMQKIITIQGKVFPT